MDTQTVGAILKKARLQAKIELRAVADETHIRLVYLEAIEENRYDELPGQVYAMGFISSYAKLLKLDEKLMLDQYRLQNGEAEQPQDLFFPQPVREDRTPNKRMIWGGVASALALAIIWAWAGHTPAPKAPEITPQINEVAVLEDPQAPVQIVETQAVSPKEQALEIKFVEKSWVKITRENGDLVFTGILSPGETYKVPQEKGLHLNAGNGAGVVLSIDGIDLPALGRSGEVVNNISLDIDQLKEIKG